MQIRSSSPLGLSVNAVLERISGPVHPKATCSAFIASHGWRLYNFAYNNNNKLTPYHGHCGKRNPYNNKLRDTGVVGAGFHRQSFDRYFIGKVWAVFIKRFYFSENDFSVFLISPNRLRHITIPADHQQGQLT